MDCYCINQKDEESGGYELKENEYSCSEAESESEVEVEIKAPPTKKLKFSDFQQSREQALKEWKLVAEKCGFLSEKKSDDKDKLLQAMLDKAPKPVETKDDYSYTVEYTLTNDSDQTFDYIQISADVFDSKGVKLGNDMTNITDVKPNQTFKLKLDLYQEGVASYKITSITSDALK